MDRSLVNFEFAGDCIAQLFSKVTGRSFHAVGDGAFRCIGRSTHNASVNVVAEPEIFSKGSVGSQSNSHMRDVRHLPFGRSVGFLFVEVDHAVFGVAND